MRLQTIQDDHLKFRVVHCEIPKHFTFSHTVVTLVIHSNGIKMTGSTVTVQ